MSFYFISLFVMALVYLLAGVSHFLFPAVFQRIVPGYLPYPKTLVVISGIIEIVLALGLMWPSTRSTSAWGLILLLIAVFPANVEQVRTKKARLGLPLWLVVLRLPVQIRARLVGVALYLMLPSAGLIFFNTF
ncbi:MAG: DoxX family protein [Owenweeksia sp.]|nr:DoxX family protein [Owenweeksia sp.]